MRVVPVGVDVGLFPLESELAWQREAACRGLGATESRALFFPTRGESVDEARAICERCPVMDECLEIQTAKHQLFTLSAPGWLYLAMNKSMSPSPSKSPHARPPDGL